MDLENIKKYTVPRPAVSSIFGPAAEFDALPNTDKDQILFLDKAASKYIFEFASAAHLITGGFWDPFEKGNFKKIESFTSFWQNDESRQLLKKWLYHRGISFVNWVFVLMNGNDVPLMMTWKMLIRYSTLLFPFDDVMVFDRTMNWCLVFFHEGEMFYGKDNIYDPTNDNLKIEALNERKRKYPKFKHPYLD